MDPETATQNVRHMPEFDRLINPGGLGWRLGCSHTLQATGYARTFSPTRGWPRDGQKGETLESSTTSGKI